MRDREKEVCLATKSSQGPLLQRNKYGCGADMDSMIHIFVCESICVDLVQRVYINAHP